MSKVTFEEDELAVVALSQENTRKDTIDILKDTLEALEEMKEDPLEDDLLETIASAISKLQMIEDKYYYSLDLNRYLNNIDILKDTLEALEEMKEDPLEDDLLETIASAISKLQMIEDKYYYSLDLNRYLNNLEDDAYEDWKKRKKIRWKTICWKRLHLRSVSYR